MLMQVPILDGSANEWVKEIEQIGVEVAIDQFGNSCEKMAPYVNEPVHVWRNDSFVAAIPSEKIHITYGIDFPQVYILLNCLLLFLHYGVENGELCYHFVSVIASFLMHSMMYGSHYGFQTLTTI